MAEIADPKKDFDAGALLQEHHKGISTLEDKVSTLEQKLKNPELLAKTLEDAAEDSKRLDKLFAKIFCDMLRSDKEVAATIQEKINAMDRDATRVFWKRFGGWVVGTIGALVVGLLGGIIDHYFFKK